LHGGTPICGERIGEGGASREEKLVGLDMFVSAGR
jgi:hypothetical protein